MFEVYLIDGFNGNAYFKFEHKDRFECEVYVEQHKYEIPKDCYYEIRNAN